MKYMMDDEETIRKWAAGFGYAVTILFWAVAATVASGILG